MIQRYEVIHKAGYKHTGQVTFVITFLTYTYFDHTVKPVLSGYSKIDKTKVLKTNGSLMKVESIAEYLH